jgi:hypothetical protein
MQEYDGFGVKDYDETEDIEDALNLELVDRPNPQNRARHHELSSTLSTPSARSSIVAMEQQVNSDILSENHVTMYQPQLPLSKEAEERSKCTLLQSFYFI